MITHANAKSKSDKFPPPHQDGLLGFPMGLSRRFEPSEIPFSSTSFTSYADEPLEMWSGPLAPVEFTDIAAETRRSRTGGCESGNRRMDVKVDGKRAIL